MPKKLSTRDIKRLETAHPYSRKAHQLRRCVHREDRLGRQRALRDGDRARQVERLLWFKFALAQDQDCAASLDEVRALVEAYVERTADERAALQAKKAPGRPPAPKLDLLKAQCAAESKEYATNGMLVPDLLDSRNVERLRSWDGDYSSLHLIHTSRVRRAATSGDA